jgi:putative hydrolase of the HAD superfamily
VRKILLLDFDHTLYPPNLTTLKAVDARINLYIQTFLGFTPEAADSLRLRLWDEYGTTLKGLEIHHGVNRDHYCDFIHAIEEAHLPPPDPIMHDWLARVPHPCYIFTNARRDWAERGLKAMGLSAILPANGQDPAGPAILAGRTPSRLLDILDIAFMEWEGKPNPKPYAKADRFLRERHGSDIRIVFADDRHDNLMEARRNRWSTIWIAPAGEHAQGSEFDRTVTSLTEIDPDALA